MKNLLGGLLLAAMMASPTAWAQEFPNRPIRIIVPYSPGGGTDTVARLMAERLTASLNQPVVVENRAGASANIGTEFVARAPADGYTILVTAPNFTTSEALFAKLAFDLLDHLAQHNLGVANRAVGNVIILVEVVGAVGHLTHGDIARHCRRKGI